jgi:putative oxidoreductase
MTFLGIVVAFAARALLVMLFLPFSALDKIVNFSQAVGQASEAAPNRSLATILILAGFSVEFFMSLAILTGIADRMAAFILAIVFVMLA